MVPVNLASNSVGFNPAGRQCFVWEDVKIQFFYVKKNINGLWLYWNKYWKNTFIYLRSKTAPRNLLVRMQQGAFTDNIIFIFVMGGVKLFIWGCIFLEFWPLVSNSEQKRPEFFFLLWILFSCDLQHQVQSAELCRGGAFCAWALRPHSPWCHWNCL